MAHRLRQAEGQIGEQGGQHSGDIHARQGLPNTVPVTCHGRRWFLSARAMMFFHWDRLMTQQLPVTRQVQNVTLSTVTCTS